MRMDQFDPNCYRGKKTVTVRTKYQGVRAVYDWASGMNKYIRRTDGKKFVAQVKRYGVQREEWFERIEDALRWRTSGDGSKVQAQRMLFSEAREKYFQHIKSLVSGSTLKTYSNSLKHLTLFEKMPVSRITPQYIDLWLSQIKRPIYLDSQHQSRFTYVKELKVLKQILKYYGDYVDDSFICPLKERHSRDAIISMDRMKEAKIKNQEKYLSGEEVLRFLEAFECIAESTGKGKLFFYLAFFQLCTGARIGEACAIHWNDVDLITGHLNISKNVQWGRGQDAETSIKPFTKTGVGRRIPMTKDLRYLLSKMKQSPSGKLVFSEDGNEPLSYRSVQHYYARAFKAAGISWKGSHVLRHTFSTNYLTATKDYVSLSRFLGHASTRQTEHYAKITGTLTDRSFETFNESAGEMFGNVLAFDQSAG